MGKFGYTNGTRHYVQTRTGNLPTDWMWMDLPFVNDEGEMKGLWCSHRYSKANERVEELMAETGLSRENYRIVKRSFHFEETVIEHDPNYGKAFNDPSLESTDDNDDDDTDSGAEDDDEVAQIIDDVQKIGEDNNEPTEVIQHHNPLAN